MRALFETLGTVNWIAYFVVLGLNILAVVEVTTYLVTHGKSDFWARVLCIAPVLITVAVSFVLAIDDIVSFGAGTPHAALASIIFAVAGYFPIWALENLEAYVWNSHAKEIDRAIKDQQRRENQKFWQTLLTDVSDLEAPGVFAVDDHGHIIRFIETV